MLYTYQAKDQQGRTTTGSVEALDERAAAIEIRAMGYFLMRLTVASGGSAGAVQTETVPENGYMGQAIAPVMTQAKPAMTAGQWLMANVVYPVWTGVSLMDMAIFYRELALLISAGLTAASALGTCLQQMPNAELRRYVAALKQVAERGGKLSEGMLLFPWIFPMSHRAMTIAGEASGDIPAIFNRIATGLEQEFTLRRNIKKELMHPVLTIVATFLIPPLVLVVLGHGQEYLRTAVLPLFLCIFCFGGLYLLTQLASQVQKPYHMILSILPAIGGAIRLLSLARFCRIFSTCFAAGVGLPKSIEYGAMACGNSYLCDRMLVAKTQLEQGVPAAQAFMAARVFPPMVVSLIGTGAVTGNFDQMLDKAAGHYEQEAQVRLHQITVGTGFLATMIIGGIVLITLVHFYTGYFNDVQHSTDDLTPDPSTQ